jgi:uncharacterized protein
MGRSVALIFGVVLAAMGAAIAAPHASFDSAKASRPVDRLICSDDGLADLDAKLALAYKKALAADANKDELRAAQRAWIAKRDAECPNAKDPVICLAQAYHNRLADLAPGKFSEVVVLPIYDERLRLTAANATTVVPLDDHALTAAHPAERGEMGFPQGTFSPKGDLFAFAVDNIVSGDPDQVWLYRLADKKLVPATPSPVKAKSSVNIEGFSFADETLYIQGSSGDYGGAQTPFKRAATMAGAHDVAAIPKATSSPGAARDTTAEDGDALSSQGDKREEDDHYVVTSTNRGHGAIVLSARAKSGGPEWTIATGTWNLADFVFDAPRARVLYGDDTRGLASYDLKTRKTMTAVPVAVGRLLDVTADGRLAAYAAYGACNAPPGKLAGRTQMICFAKLP